VSDHSRMMRADLPARMVPNLRWNFSMVVLNGTAFKLVDTLVNPSLVLVVFLSQLTDNPVILGMPKALWIGGFMLSQLPISGRVQRLTYALPLYRFLSVGRMLMWICLLVGTLVTDDPHVLISVMLLFLVGYPLVSGMGALPFFEVVGKTIPPRLRGPVFSWRLALGGLMGLGGGWFVNRVLSDAFPLTFPRNFAVLFGVAAVASLLGFISFFLMREPAGEPHPPQGGGLRGRWQEIRTILREDRLYRHYVIARMTLLLAVSTSPLFIIYANRRFDLPLSSAAAYLVADTITGLLVVVASGWFSIRFGNRRLLIAAVLLSAVMFAMLLFSFFIPLTPDAAFGYFMVVFVLLAAYTGSSGIGFVALNMNIPPEDQRPLYIGLANTLFGTVSYISIGQGVLVALMGYPGLFVIAAGLMLLGVWQVIGYLYDPTETAEAIPDAA
jgi:hypothetical protein